jgi:hypothetical protein
MHAHISAGLVAYILEKDVKLLKSKGPLDYKRDNLSVRLRIVEKELAHGRYMAEPGINVRDILTCQIFRNFLPKDILKSSPGL